ncbi:hypothetical protein [Marinoscillum sp.]|uniref:hypothetical protein n=1 Tax=Marinoscillum sp. TaxID=2024838 RepID=UPI003BAD014D
MNKKLISKKRTYVLSKGNKPLGVLKFPKWYSSNAIIELRHEKIEVKQKGFWGTSFEIKKNGLTIGTITSNWKSQLKIQLKDLNKRNREFMLKAKGVFKIHYDITDEQKKTVFTLHTISSWTKFKNDYEVQENMLPGELNATLLALCACFCTVIYTNHMAASAAATG